jgi:hypothetical protein
VMMHADDDGLILMALPTSNNKQAIIGQAS